MSFNQLRDELYYCQDPVKKLIIRKIMKQKYFNALKIKNMRQQKQNRLKKIYKNYRQRYDKKKSEEILQSLMEENIEKDDGFDFTDEDFEPKQQESEKQSIQQPIQEPKHKIEYERDFLNNGLMNRLSNDIAIKNTLARGRRLNNK